MEKLSVRGALPSMTPLANIDPERFRLINSILMTILTSDVAESTFAQIIDGPPTRNSFEHNTATRTLDFEIASRDEPTQQSRSIFREFRDQLQPAFITLDSKVCSSHNSSIFLMTNSYDQLRQFRLIRIPLCCPNSFHSDF